MVLDISKGCSIIRGTVEPDFLTFYTIIEDVILSAYKNYDKVGIACYRYNILIFAKIKFERHEISVSQI